jgi:hypothetical protein
MADDRESQLKIYSLGIVTEVKDRQSDYIKVSPIEDITMGNGKLSEDTRQYDIKVPDARGVKQADTLKGDSAIVAKWVPLGHSNRITAPDVVPGETVVLLRFADTDSYYWTTIFREPTLRRLETVNYGFCDLPSGMGAFDKDSSYYAEVSTHDKYIHIHTSKSDGEAFEYDIIIDTGRGTVSIDDNSGNSIKLDSNAGSADVATNNTISLKSPSVTIDASNVEVNGTLKVSGSITSGGGITASGAVHGTNI